MQSLPLSGLLGEDTLDEHFIQMAFLHKDRIDAPIQSLFRVFAVVVFRDAETPVGQVGYLCGTNCECCFLCNNICAERSALGQLRFKRDCKVHKIFIASDSKEYITPGMLCREFMFNHYCDQTTLITTCGENKVPRTFTLGSLFPYPSLYTNVKREQLLDFGKQLSSKCQSVQDYLKEDPLALELFHQTVRLSQAPDEPSPSTSDTIPPSLSTTHLLHPISYSSGALFRNHQTLSIPHHVAIEYGCFLDALSRLTPYLESERAKANPPTFLIQADQYGVLHAPCAVARAYLFERGFGDVPLLLHDSQGRLAKVLVKELVLCSPSVEELFRRKEV